MSVLLSLLTWVPGKMGGSETYVNELLEQLSLSQLEVSTLTTSIAAGRSRGLPERVIRSMGHSSPPGRLFDVVRAQLPHAWGGDADVVHFPFTVPAPRPKRRQRSVVTLHDVQHLDMPSMFSRSERGYRSVFYDRAAQRADAVVTVSEFTRSRIVHHLGIAQERIRVAPLGVRPAAALPPHGVRREPFLLYPAKTWPHKNHRTLFEAFAHVRQRRPDLELVLTSASDKDLSSLPPGVRALGHVARSELMDLYRRASLLVFPSRYEGFGLPIIEAMAHGCPVALSDLPALREVAGDVGTYFDPLDPEGMAEVIEAALEDEVSRSPGCVERAAMFTWRRCAEVHERVYLELGA